MKVKVIQVGSSQCQHGSGACLTEEDLDFWYEAIRADDIESVEKYLTSVGESRKIELLHGHMCAGNFEATFDNIKGLNLAVAKKVAYFRPMHIASFLAAQKLIELCLKNGVSLFEQDKNGDNLVHALIRASAEIASFEKKHVSILKLYKTELTTDQLCQLFHQENNDGYRPLELAAHYGTFALFTEIFMTNDIYRKGKKNIGMLSLRYYDVTEYESYEIEKNRRMKSPLWFLCHLESKLLGKEATKEFFASNPIKVWCELKIKANWLLMFLWFLLRLSIATLSIYWDLSGGSLTLENRVDINNVINGNLSVNETDCNIGTYVALQAFIAPNAISLILRYILVGSAFGIVLFDILELIMWLRFGWFKRFFRTFAGRRKSLVSNGFEFRIVQTLSCFSCIAMFLSIVFEQKTVFNISYLTYSTFLTWSLLYFAQLLPWIGPKVIGIERLIKELLSYAVIIGLLVVPMSYTITSLLTKNHIGPCPADINFTDFFQTVYRGFTILLNMVPLTNYPLQEYLSIYAYHLIFVFLISILMLNFVIASFSTTIATLQENEQAVDIIQRLSIAMQVEYRVGAVFPCLIHSLHKWAFQYCPNSDAFYVNRLLGRSAP